MARITVEDCLEKVANRFELVMVAAKRARDLTTHGAPATLEWENDKPTVMALREIAAGNIDKTVLDVRLGGTQTAHQTFGGVHFMEDNRRPPRAPMADRDYDDPLA